MLSKALVYLGSALAHHEVNMSLLGSLKNIIKLLLQSSRFRQWPIRFLLMTENDILQDRSRYTEEQWDFFIHF